MSWFDTLVENYFGNGTLNYLIFVAVTFFFAFLMRTILKKVIERLLSGDVDNVDKTKFNFLKNALSAFIYLLTLLFVTYSIPPLRSLALTLFAGAGILAAILAFAGQAAFSNIIGGIFIVIFKPFRVGDNVKIGDLYLGIVEDITLRHTVIRNFENRRIIMPNSAISSETILNSTIEDQKICNFIEVDISYESNIDNAIKIITEESLAHPNLIDNRSDEQKENNDPVVRVKVIMLGENGVRLRAYVWAENTAKAWEQKTDLYKSIKENFDKNGVVIPYPQRTVHIKKSD